ncbi:MAG: sugar phosphate nucleotidyltransferase [Vampirovibrionales bacterium]|nr:sugar phosphate nucleotidyltransferase [Vampirovibrionales bacterium]
MVTLHATSKSKNIDFKTRTYDGSNSKITWDKQNGAMHAVIDGQPIAKIENLNSKDLTEVTAFEGKGFNSLILDNHNFTGYALPGTKVTLKHGTKATAGEPNTQWQIPSEQQAFFTNPKLVLRRLRNALKGYDVVIGAGGKGTRAQFGIPGLKPTLPVDKDHSFLTHHIGQISSETPDSITVVAPPGYGQEYMQHVRERMGDKTPTNLNIIEQPNSKQSGLTGSGYGILTGIENKIKPTFFIPVDPIQSKLNFNGFMEAFKKDGKQQYAAVLGGMPVGKKDYRQLGVAMLGNDDQTVEAFREKPESLTDAQLSKAYVNTFAMLFDPKQAKKALEEHMQREKENIKVAQRGERPAVDLDFMKEGQTQTILQEQTRLPLGMVPHGKSWCDATSQATDYRDSMAAKNPNAAKSGVIPLGNTNLGRVKASFIQDVTGAPIMVADK